MIRIIFENDLWFLRCFIIDLWRIEKDCFLMSGYCRVL